MRRFIPVPVSLAVVAVTLASSPASAEPDAFSDREYGMAVSVGPLTVIDVSTPWSYARSSVGVVTSDIMQREDIAEESYAAINLANLRGVSTSSTGTQLESYSDADRTKNQHSVRGRHNGALYESENSGGEQDYFKAAYRTETAAEGDGTSLRKFLGASKSRVETHTPFIGATSPVTSAQGSLELSSAELPDASVDPEEGFDFASREDATSVDIGAIVSPTTVAAHATTEQVDTTHRTVRGSWDVAPVVYEFFDGDLKIELLDPVHGDVAIDATGDAVATWTPPRVRVTDPAGDISVLPPGVHTFTNPTNPNLGATITVEDPTQPISRVLDRPSGGNDEAASMSGDEPAAFVQSDNDAPEFGVVEVSLTEVVEGETHDLATALLIEVNAFGYGPADGIVSTAYPDSDGDGLNSRFETVNRSSDESLNSDTDTLSDHDEAFLHNTSPGDGDSDGDGLDDAAELAADTDPLDYDTDNDALADGAEVTDRGTDPTRYDTDGGGIPDGAEALIKEYDANWELIREFDPTDPSDDAAQVDTDGDNLPDEWEDQWIGSSPENLDSDGDGLSDVDEIRFHGTQPGDADTDRDLISDSQEMAEESDPQDENDFYDAFYADSDSDNDGLSDSTELAGGTKRKTADTDSDGLTDGVEVNQYGTSPLNVDTDGDGRSDYEEVQAGTDPNTAPGPDPDPTPNPTPDPEPTPNPTPDPNADVDADGLSSADEARYGTDPTNPDTDADTLADGAEIKGGTNPTKADTDNDGLGDAAEYRHGANPVVADTDGDTLLDGIEVTRYRTSPTDADTDTDGLDDGQEVTGTQARNGRVYVTDPLLGDTDGDGLNDRIEMDGSANPRHKVTSNPLKADTDRDGLSDRAEVKAKSNPTKRDTDADGVSDKREVRKGLNPNSRDTDGDGVSDKAELAKPKPNKNKGRR